MTASSFRFGIFRPFGRSSRRRLPLALAGLAVLAGCAGEPESRPCPQAVVLNDASRQVKFNGQGRDLTDVLFEASISAGRLVCAYDDNVLDVDLQVEVIAARGPANSDRLANITYFVAASQVDPTLLALEGFHIAIQTGRATCRERVWSSVYISVDPVPLKKKYPSDYATDSIYS